MARAKAQRLQDAANNSYGSHGEDSTVMSLEAQMLQIAHRLAEVKAVAVRKEAEAQVGARMSARWCPCVCGCMRYAPKAKR